MARQRRLSLDVFSNGRKVGVYIRAADGRIVFQYDDDWLVRADPIPVSLSLPLQERPYVGAPVSAVFENLLPDNDKIRQTIAERYGAQGTDAFSLLAEIGRDCVGALQFIPTGETAPDVRRIEAEPVTDAMVAAQLKGLAQAPLGLDPEADFRISIAGAQEKTAFLKLGDKWQRPKGATPTTHIMKPPIGPLPNGIDMTKSVENEWLCMTLARELGLPVANTEIADFDGVRALVVERFDRQWARDRSWIIRRPQEDLLQALGYPPTQKYENERGPGINKIMDLLKASDQSKEDRLIFLRAQVVFWLMGAIDGHAKNFSIFLAPGGSFRLTPLYDIMSVDPAIAMGQLSYGQAKLAMAVGDHRHYRLDEIVLRHWQQTAKRCDVNSNAANDLFEDITDSVDRAVEQTANQIPEKFPGDISGPILESVRQRARWLRSLQLEINKLE